MCISKIQTGTLADDQNSAGYIERRSHPASTGGVGSKQGGTQRERCSERGFATLGAALLSIIFTVSVGLFLILNQINHKIEYQIELDQFTGSIAIQLRAAIITKEQSEKRLKIAKAAMLAGCMNLFACAGFQSAYALQEKVEKGIQALAKAHWEEQRIKFLIYKPLLSSKGSFPSMDQYTGATVKIQYANLTSAAKIWTDSTGGITHDWKIAWIE